jgi:hypothetical protein
VLSRNLLYHARKQGAATPGVQLLSMAILDTSPLRKMTQA